MSSAPAVAERFSINPNPVGQHAGLRNFVARILIHGERDRAPRDALVLPRVWNDSRVSESGRWSFAELAERVNTLRIGFRKEGFVRGDRVILMCPVSFDLYCTVLALLASGMTAVLIDAGMGKRKILQSIADARAQAIVSSNALLRYHAVLPVLWRLRKYSTDSRGLFVRSTARCLAASGPIERPVAVQPSDHALITFTSGSTGRPKGADRTHELLTEQHLALSAAHPMRPSDVHLTCFPVVALHNLACGISTVLPAVDLRAPATVAPAAVVQQIREHDVTLVTAAPAFMETLTQYMLDEGIRLPSVRSVGVGGAPVHKRLCADVLRAFPQAVCKVVYGSTEAEPIASVSMVEVVESSHCGYLVGRPEPTATVRLVKLPPSGGTQHVDALGVESFCVPQGEVGEVVVTGRHVNRAYIDNPAADAESKLRDPTGTIWHRTGDTAHEDPHGRLWLVGRAKDQIIAGHRVLHPLPLEAELDAAVGVRRSAVVQLPGNGAVIAALQLKPLPASRDRESSVCDTSMPAAVLADVSRILQRNGLPRAKICSVSTMPVDGRHNSKIDRPALRRMFRRRLS